MRILLVADDPLARAGLSALLTEEEDLEIVMQLASDDLSLFGAVKDYTPAGCVVGCGLGSER